jgi:hypothetical protein
MASYEEFTISSRLRFLAALSKDVDVFRINGWCANWFAKFPGPDLGGCFWTVRTVFQPLQEQEMCF